MAPRKTKPSTAPTNDAAKSAKDDTAVHSEQAAAAAANGAAATPPGESVPGGTNTGSADGKRSATTSTEGHDQAGAGAATAPVTSNTSQGDDATGAGNTAGPDAAPAWKSMNKEEFVAAYPLISALIASLEEPPTSGEFRVVAKTNGFRRAGFVHSSQGRTFRSDEVTPDQLEAMLAEPELTVEIV
ncbi:hypothetical protein RHAB21_00716 [Pseudorhizobium halotolerans]|uniref:Mu-like prophage FluMu N-terminal domain-containing protein n=1 Tax=Pseudorhizobium halotolerans TaxID=1233081 RepID=A0ABM8PYW7_9HYPH|nr:HI1506-related protein [Pseudorhizobium halotolerans]CAD7055429.1 hypothetical protein RHAB21_00716 [Pseudorhizobium halotolerans]